MSAPRSFGRDPGLQARMLATMFLLGLVYVVLIAVLIAAGVGAVAVAAIAGALFLVQYFSSDKLALRSMGAQEVSAQDAPELHATIDRLCIQADLPMPRVAIADTPMPNAFAVGRSPSTATVCVTTGLLALLDQPELEGVLGHELTHVANRDVMLMTIASFFASIASFIVQFGFFFGGGFGGGNDRDDNGGGGVSLAVVILVSGVVYVVSFVLLHSLSRYREFAADRGSAIITGRPSALASALMKIDGQMDRIPQRDLRAASGELAAFYIFPPKAKQTVATLFSTHPSLEARLAALGRLESQLQGTR
ncbi:MAG TPA: zinc metalloprotease HtpX [Solirubrobacteraceae bacterium]